MTGLTVLPVSKYSISYSNITRVHTYIHTCMRACIHPVRAWSLAYWLELPFPQARYSHSLVLLPTVTYQFYLPQPTGLRKRIRSTFLQHHAKQVHTGSDDVTAQPCTNVWQWSLHKGRTTRTARISPRTEQPEQAQENEERREEEKEEEEQEQQQRQKQEMKGQWRDENNKINTPTNFNANLDSKETNPKLYSGIGSVTVQ